MAVPSDLLLHPELLTNEQLIYIINERHLRVPNIERMARHELLEVFHNFCVPYGQRKYRDSGRGKILNRTRNTSPPLENKMDCDHKQAQKRLHPDSHDRLKQPPDMLTGKMKRIKIEVMATNNVNNFKRIRSIDGATLEVDVPPRKKERKLITWP